MISVKPQLAVLKIWTVLVFICLSLLTRAQVYETSASAYWELQPQFIENGDVLNIYFNLKFEDRSPEGDDIHDILEELNISWNGQIIYYLEHFSLVDNDMGSGYDIETFNDYRFDSDTYEEQIWQQTRPALSFNKSHTTAYDGTQDVVQIQVSVNLTQFENQLTESLSGESRFRLWARYYDRGSGGSSHDSAGEHFSQYYTLQGTEENENAADDVNVVSASHENAGLVDLSFTLEKRENELYYDHADELVLYHRAEGEEWQPVLLIQHTALGTDIPSSMSDLSVLQDDNFSGPNGDSYRYRVFNEELYLPDPDNYVNSSTSSDVNFRINHYYGDEDFGVNHYYSLEGNFYIRDYNGIRESQSVGNDNRATINTALKNDGSLFDLPELSLNDVSFDPSSQTVNLSWDEPFVFSDADNQQKEYIRIYRNNTLITRVPAHSSTSYSDASISLASDYSYFIVMEYERFRGGSLFSEESVPVNVSAVDDENNTGADEIDIINEYHDARGFVSLDLLIEKREEELFYDHADELILYQSIAGVGWKPILLLQHTSLGTDLPSAFAGMTPIEDHIITGPADTYRVRNFSETIDFENIAELSSASTSEDLYLTIRHYYRSEDLGGIFNYSWEGDMYIRDGQQSYSLFTGNQIRAEVDASQVGGESFEFPEINLQSAQLSDTECQVELSWLPPEVMSNQTNATNEFMAIYRDGQLIDRVNAHAASSYTDDATDLLAGENYSYHIEMQLDRSFGGSLVSIASAAKSVAIPKLEAPVGVLTQQADCDGGITVDWIWQGASSPDAFIIQRQKSDGPFETIEPNLDGSFRDYTDNDVEEGQQYTYRIAGVGSVCNSIGYFSPGRTHSRDTLDISNTIIRDALSTSKGYYGDRTELFWKMTGQNEEYINRFRIYARELGTNVSPVLLESPGRDDRSWIHDRGDAGTIYEYFVVTERVVETECGFETTSSFPIESVVGLGNLHQNLPDSGVAYAVGFRSPTAVINGSITYSGGVAVPDVKVVVEPTNQTPGKSLYFNGDSRVTVESTPHINVDTALTLSAWVKPTRLDPNVMLFKDGSYGLEYNGTEAFMFVRDTLDQTAHVVRVPAEDYKIGNWVNLTCTYSSSSGALNLYVNGEKTGETVYVPEGRRIINKTQSSFLIGDYNSPGYEFQGNMDEIRIYNRALTAKEVQREYGRITSTDAKGLVAYWKVQEGAGKYIYDAAHLGSFFYKHDGAFSHGVQWSDDVPSRTQLGIAAFTQANGSYSIEGIPYAGNGQNFQVIPTITLADVVHEFDPVSQTIFLGEGNIVENKVNFEDISVFEISGRILYDFEDTEGSGTKSIGSAGVQLFLDGTKPIKDANDNPITTDANGNFSVSIPIGLHYISFEKEDHTFSHGARWPSTGFYNFQADVSGVTLYDQTLHKFVGTVAGGTSASDHGIYSIYQINNLGEAYFEITSTDNIISRRVETDSLTGTFEVELPPLQYNISSIKWSNDDLEIVASQDIQPLNLGSEGAYEGQYEMDSTLTPILVQQYPTVASELAIDDFRVDSVSDTQIFYSWKLKTSEMVSESHIWVNDTDTVTYFIDSEPAGFAQGVYHSDVIYGGTNAYNENDELPNALLIRFENSEGEIFELGIQFNAFTPETLYKYDTTGYEYIKDSIFYNVRRDFIYRELPTLEVVTAGDTLFSGEKTYGNIATEDLTIDLKQLPYPTFFTNDFYQLEIRANEIYTNKDNGVQSEIPVTDGNIIVNNGIGTPFIYDEDGRKQYGQGAQKTLNKEGVATYDFVGGDPSFVQITSTGEEQNSFTKTINVSLEINGQSVTWPADPVNDPQRAYVLGIQAIPGANFVTAAPETVEFILRDPPGSDSYAYREAGTTFSVSEEFIASGFGGLDRSLGGGVAFDLAGGGSFGGHIEIGGSVDATAQIGIDMEMEATTGATVERSMETTETITTNDQPIEIGASDVFVAKSHNLETGYAMRVQPLPLDECAGNCFGDIITMPNGNQFQMGASMVSYINPEGFPTYVVYTQNHIETVLIPELEKLRNILLVESPSYSSQLTPDHEMYGTNNDDPNWGAMASTSNYIKTEAEDLTGPSYTFNNAGDDTRVDSIRFYNQQIRLWEEALAFNEIEKWAAFNAGNQENVSLASGVQLERSMTNTASSVSMVSMETSMALTLDVDVSLNVIIAGRANLDAELGLKTTSTSTRGEEATNTFGYVLHDSDENDAYSIDIAPGVGGNSPVFATVAGQTSCPYEPGLEMKYATPEFIDRAIADRQALITKLTKSKNITDILKTQLEEEIQSIQDDVKGLEADVKKYTDSQIKLIKAKADINKIFEDMQNMVREIGENAANALVQKAVGPVVGGVNDFIGTLQDIRIPIPFSRGISPFESIPTIPQPSSPTGDFAFDFSQMEEIMLKRLKDAEKIATETINRTTELITQVQNRIKKRLLDLNNLTIKLKEYELDLEKINNEIDAINEQIVQFQQLQSVLQSTTEPIMLSNATLQREKPTLQINGAKTAQVYNVPADETANFRLLLGNESESGHSQYYAVEVLDHSNPNGLVLKIDGETLNEPREYWVDGNSAITKVMTVERGPFEYDYNNVQVVIHSTCQYDPNSNTALIVDTVSFDVRYIPTCSDVAILAPQNNWVGNNSSDGVLPVHIGKYDINSTGLEYIQIEYKASSSSEWLQMVRYYRDEQVDEWLSGDPTLPQTGNEFVYEWDFSELGIPDGNYDIRVVAQCQLAKTESEVHSGLIDTVNPHLFGTPNPADGIYSAGDEIAIQFNEPINEGLIQPSDFKITGVLNGADIRHNASVYFGGNSNQYMEIAQGINLTRKSFSIDMYAKRNGAGAAVLFAQGGAADRSLVLGFDASDHLYLSVDGDVLTSDLTITDTKWHHLAFVYDHANSDATIYIDALEHGINNSYAQDYQSSGRIFIGKSTFGNELPYSGNIHELRIWNIPLSITEVNIAATKRMTSSERGLVGNWRMEEAQGEIAEDHIRSKHALVYGQWTIEPGGLAYSLDGVNHLEANSPAFTSASDFTLEFWVNGAATSDSVTFISNGRGDGKDSNTAGWSVGTNQSAQLIVKNNDAVIETGMTVLDNTWYHVAVAVNRTGNAVCYLDGKEAANIPAVQVSGFGGSKLWIGARGWYEGTVERIDQQFAGSIDEIRIWNLAKRKDHISTEIQNKLGGDETGLVLYYPFESYQDMGGGILNVAQTDENQAINTTDNTLLGINPANYVENTPTIKLPRPVENVNFNFSSNNDKIILSPTVEAGMIENVILTISVKNISDLNGNRLVSPITWTAYVDRSTLNWVEAEKSFDVPIGEGVKFTAEIYNQGGNIETFNLMNLPVWLSATPASGSVKPLTAQTIEFTISDGTNIGSYVQDIVMENSFGFDERLILNLNVFMNPPEDWTVNPEDYEYSMSVLSRVRIKGEFSRDENDLIAAFVNGQCRGVANLEYITSQDNYQAYISVYSNQLTGESIDYRIWNASEGLVHTFVTNSDAGVETFSADGFFGTIINPVIFDAGVNIEQTQEIKSGWQWLSFNLTSNDFTAVNTFMEEFQSADGDQIKSNQFYDQYDPVNGWVGTITANGGIQSGEMYKFRLANAGKLKYRGEPVDPATNPVTVNEGWNWVSFLGQNLIPINEALANITGLSVGDVIKSQRQFATYGGAGVGWIGSLKVMQPGQGYMYRAAVSGDIVYPQVASSARVETPDFGYISKVGLDAFRFPDNMNMIVETNYEYDYLLAYAGEELRGIAVPEYNPVIGATVYFMTVFGHAKTALTFEGVIGDWTDNLSCEETIVFSGTSALGSLSEPILMVGSVLSTDHQFMVSVYPNPAADKFEVRLSKGSYDRISIMSLSGQELFNREIVPGEKQLILDVAHMASGVYLLKVIGVQSETIKLVIE